ncbi:MAG: hypothetical protein ACREN8_11365 [Candidatus Dormibacteraceae bacterium]
MTTLTGDPAWQIRGYDLVKALLSDPRLGRSHPNPENASRLSESVLIRNPSGSPGSENFEHARMRRLLTPAFSARRLGVLRTWVQTLVDDLLDKLEPQTPPVDLHEALSFPLPVLFICQLLGVPYADREDFRQWSRDLGNTIDSARSRNGMEQLIKYMHSLIEDKRTNPGEDIISDLIEAQIKDSTLTNDYLSELATGLLFAGHETTVAAMIEEPYCY